MPDPPDLMRQALRQRDNGDVLHPSMHDYDGAMQRTWGGPAPKWFPMAMAKYPKQFAAAAGRTALVTGGTGGIGFYVAKLLAAANMTVIIPARPNLMHEAKSAQQAITAAIPTASVSIPDVPLDLGSFDSVRAFGAHMREQDAATRIDTLVLNAGRGGSATGELEASADGPEVIMQVNLLGHAALTAELLPLLRRSDYVRIAAQSSGARFNAREADLVADLGTSLAAVRALGRTPWDQYSISKAGACLLARALQDKLGRVGIVARAVTSADPGLAATGVNVQHDLAATLGGRLPDTKALHDAAAHHAADGALPIALAALEGKPNAFYSPTGSRAGSLADAAMPLTERQVRRGDPVGWAEATVDAFWERLAEATPGLGDAFALKDEL